MLLVAHLLTVLPSVHRAVDGTPFYEVVEDTLYLLAGLVVAARAVLVRRDRWAWALFSIGLLSYAAGNIVYISYVQHLDPEPFPSVSDALWLPLYPFAYAGIVLLLRRQAQRWHTSLWLDGLVAALGVGACAVALVLQPVLHATDGNLLAVLMNLAYPVADLLLLSLVVAVFATMAWRPTVTWLLLAFGLLGFVVADCVYLLMVGSDSYVNGSWVDSVWLIGLVPMTLAAWMRPVEEHTTASPDGWLLLAVPAAFTSIAVGLLVWGSLRESTPSPLVVGLSAGTIIASLFRTSLTFREVRALADARLEARTDDLTGLGNRRFFLEKLEELTGGHDCEPVAVLLIDLDSFKEVNDSYGHQTGDALLCLVGPRLLTALRPGGT